MDLVLTKIETVFTEKSVPLKEGLIILYYAINWKWKDCPEEGEVKKVKGDFFIEWFDGSTPTKIDNSEHSQSILKYCGFKY